MSTQLNPTRMLGFVDPQTGFELNLRGMCLDQSVLDGLMLPQVWKAKTKTPPPTVCDLAHQAMLDIVNGKEMNPDEGRQVTHFSDRETYCSGPVFKRVDAFVKEMLAAKPGARLEAVDAVIVNGIGGSALGPQLLQFALNGPTWNDLPKTAPEGIPSRKGYPKVYFLDNTDTTGLQDVLAAVDLRRTLVVTLSKSGRTKETRNNLRALQQAYAAAKIAFADHGVAVTLPDADPVTGSELYIEAISEPAWLESFDMAESIGGRTSVTNIVGHVPAALCGIAFDKLVAGGRHMDQLTAVADPFSNPAYQLAITWYAAGNGRGDRNMVIVPYADRLVLLSRYLQQLVMESLGKERALDGRLVNQGLNVFGNKGGTDAHAYIQQLNDGRDDFVVTFIEVLKDVSPVEVENDVTMGDYLHAFCQGLTNALTAKGRQVITITIEELNPYSLGMLIALYERAVAYYAALIGVNAFHQPGVQSYKKASDAITDLSESLRAWIPMAPKSTDGLSAATIAELIGVPAAAAEVSGLLAKFALNQRCFKGVTVNRAWHGEWRFTFTKVSV